jgi:hypothetical protein
VHGRDGGFLRGKEENLIADVLPITLYAASVGVILVSRHRIIM